MAEYTLAEGRVPTTSTAVQSHKIHLMKELLLVRGNPVRNTILPSFCPKPGHAAAFVLLPRAITAYVVTPRLCTSKMPLHSGQEGGRGEGAKRGVVAGSVRSP